MLIDIPDPANTDRVTFRREPTGTGWIIRGTFPGADLIDMPLYQRLRLGVYSGSAAHFAEVFTDLRVVHSCTWQKPLFDALTEASKSGDGARHQAALDAFNEELSAPEYGRADDLEQILASGKRFVDGPHRYILEVHAYDNTGKTYKQGPYIGTGAVEATEVNGWSGRSPAEVIAFSWVRLEPKESAPPAGVNKGEGYANP
jgi:hypothetical protein